MNAYVLACRKFNGDFNKIYPNFKDYYGIKGNLNDIRSEMQAIYIKTALPKPIKKIIFGYYFENLLCSEETFANANDYEKHICGSCGNIYYELPWLFDYCECTAISNLS